MIFLPMASITTYAQWLKAMRREKRMTQQDLAEATGMARTYLSAVEGGKVRMPKSPNRERIHRVFGSSDRELEDLNLIAWDGFGNEIVPEGDAPLIERREAGDEDKLPAGMSPGAWVATSDSAARISALVRLVAWSPDREYDVTKTLLRYVEEDRQQEVTNGSLLS